MRLPLLVLFALFAVRPALADSDWQEVFSVSGRSVQVDAASIRTKGDLARFWWKQIAPEPTLELGRDNTPYQFLSTLSEVDCALKTLRHREEVRFNRTGPFVYTTLDVSNPPQPIPDGDALGQALAGFVCTHLPPAAAPEATESAPAGEAEQPSTP